MRTLAHQTMTELRIFVRNKQTVFFTVAFPMLMMVMFGSMRTSSWRGTGGVEYLPFLLGGIIGMAVLSSAFENLSQNTVKERETGILKRLGGTPLSRGTMLSSKIISAAVIILLQVVVLIAIGVAFFDIEVGGRPLELLAILALGITTFTSLGFALACMVRSTSTASVASHAAYIPMLFACGAFFPMEATPKVLQEAAKFLPLTYFLDPLRDTIGGASLIEGNLEAIGILVLWMIAGSAVSVRMFKWE